MSIVLKNARKCSLLVFYLIEYTHEIQNVIKQRERTRALY